MELELRRAEALPMPVQNWSDKILLVDLQDDPAFSDDINAVIDQAQADPDVDVALDFTSISYLNSSNIAKLLKLRKIVSVNNKRKLVLCAINTHVWGVFLVTGLDKIFEFADDVGTGLTGLQMGRQETGSGQPGS
jgi:anti-anti-sigma factor